MAGALLSGIPTRPQKHDGRPRGKYPPCETAKKETSFYGALSSNSWTWGNAHSYFFNGLTAPENTTPNQNPADLFTALGHLTHLVADISVPGRSRNDAQIIFPHYETWCKDKPMNVDTSIDGVRVFENAFPPDNAIFAMGRGYAFGSVPSPRYQTYGFPIRKGEHTIRSPLAQTEESNL